MQHAYTEALRLLKAGQYAQALLWFDKALAAEPQNATYLSDKGVTLFHLGQKAEALALLDEAQALEPTNPYRYSSRAFLKDAMGDTEGAIADYKQAIALDPEDMIAYNNLGLLEEKLGYKQAAQEKYRQADALADKYGFLFGAQEDEVPPSEAKKPMEQPLAAELPKEEEQAKKMTWQHYGKVVKEVFSSKKRWEEFINFVLRKS